MNMDKPNIKRVVIAGGGTAGWVTAAALSRHLGSIIEIILVESDEIGTVGVGEATIPTSRSFHAMLGIDEREFMAATQATFKLSISFENWGAAGERYVHSFGQIGKSTWMSDFHHFWLEAKAQGFGGSLSEYCFELQASEAGKFQTGGNIEINYAYHLDATRYARYLRGHAENCGVTRIEGRIEAVQQNGETGHVTALKLQSGLVVKGDLFIDCTGFGGLLIEGALKTGYDDWSHWLPANRAVAVQTRSVRDPVPYTRAIAHDAGWRWQIPLQTRTGNGFVYSSEFLGNDEAERHLRDAVDGEMITAPRQIRFVTGKRRKVWNKNVIAIGLSSGFVEPLESTSIHLFKIAVTRLIQMFPFGGISEALVDRYNQIASREMESVRDFIIAHYHVTQRPEPLWQYCRNMAIPDSLAERLALFREQGHAYQGGDDLFRVDSWVQVLMGQGIMPQRHHRVAALMPAGRLEQALNDLRGGITRAVSAMPAHRTFVESYCPAPKD
jgi:tryptophan 7-halogenase